MFSALSNENYLSLHEWRPRWERGKASTARKPNEIVGENAALFSSFLSSAHRGVGCTEGKS